MVCLSRPWAPEQDPLSKSGKTKSKRKNKIKRMHLSCTWTTWAEGLIMGWRNPGKGDMVPPRSSNWSSRIFYLNLCPWRGKEGTSVIVFQNTPGVFIKNKSSLLRLSQAMAFDLSHAGYANPQVRCASPHAGCVSPLHLALTVVYPHSSWS